MDIREFAGIHIADGGIVTIIGGHDTGIIIGVPATDTAHPTARGGIPGGVTRLLGLVVRVARPAPQHVSGSTSAAAPNSPQWRRRSCRTPSRRRARFLLGN